MVELQEASWLTWFTEPSGVFLSIIIPPCLLIAIIVIARRVFDTIRGARGFYRGFGDKSLFTSFIASLLVCTGLAISLNLWIDVNDSEAQVKGIEEAYDVSLFDVDKDGDVKDFGKMRWDHLMASTDDTYQSQEPVAIREDGDELRTDAVLVLEREDLDDPFSASLAIPEDPESGKTLVDYKTGEIVGESTVDTEEEETD